MEQVVFGEPCVKEEGVKRGRSGGIPVHISTSFKLQTVMVVVAEVEWDFLIWARQKNKYRYRYENCVAQIIYHE